MEADAAKAFWPMALVMKTRAYLPPAVLPKLTLDDLFADTFLEIGVPKDGVMHVEWSGRLYQESEQITGEADYTGKAVAPGLAFLLVTNDPTEVSIRYGAVGPLVSYNLPKCSGPYIAL